LHPLTLPRPKTPRQSCRGNNTTYQATGYSPPFVLSLFRVFVIVFSNRIAKSRKDEIAKGKKGKVTSGRGDYAARMQAEEASAWVSTTLQKAMPKGC
jgi:hypothetical protein